MLCYVLQNDRFIGVFTINIIKIRVNSKKVVARHK